MKTRFLLGGVVALAIMAGCQKQEAPAPVKPAVPQRPSAVQLVPEKERSRHFEAVNRNLELGGTLYGYVDIDGDPQKLIGFLRTITGRIADEQPAIAPFIKQDYEKIFATLGLNDIKAAGISSVPAASGGFRNRAFFYMPQGRHGLFAGLGGAPAPFSSVKLAPADVDLYGEGEIDLPAIYAAVRAVVAQVGGEATATMLENNLKNAGKEADFSMFALIQSLKGRCVTVLRLDPERTMKIPTCKTPFVIPGVSLLMRIDGLGGALQGALAKLPTLAKAREGNLDCYTFKAKLPVEGLSPVIAIEGTTLYVATTREFLLECLNRKAGLDQNPDFQRALGEVGREGNALAYCSPKFMASLRQLGDLNQDAAPEVRRFLATMKDFMPVVAKPVVSARINLPDGILIRSSSYRSFKQELVMVAVYNPVTIGLMASMAIPAFQKVRQASQEKAILNNLRQLAAAADQYYLENGVDTVTYDKLVGPDRYIRRIMPVAGESYRSLRFKQGQPLIIRTPDGRIIRHDP